MASSLSSGERVVIFLFIARLFYSTPSSLFCESIALIFLATAAFFTEIYVENSEGLGLFNIRQGASSGILLGAVTLPALIISKLIQLSRALLSGEDQYIGVWAKDFAYEKMLYWTTCICCFTVLAFIFLVKCRSSNTTSPLVYSSWMVWFSFISAVSVVCMPQQWPSVSKLVWMLSHGVADVHLVQHIFHTFPSCASIGETLLVATGLIVFSGDMLRSILLKGGLVSPYIDFVENIQKSQIIIIVQVVLLGLLIFPLALKLALKIRSYFKRSSCSNSQNQNEICKSAAFFGSLVFYLIIIIPMWIQFVQNLEVHPLLWVLRFIFLEPLKTLPLCIYWVTVIYWSVQRFYQISKSSTTERILLRKYYHLMAVIMFVPALILQPEFLNLAFGAALAVFIVLEMIRIWRVWPLGDFIHQFMNAFTDHRDSDLLVISHFSLLLGCALPIWMSSHYNDRPLAPFAGILSLGIGDTMASMIGHKYGVLRWSKSGKKTVEGTAGGIACVLLACCILLFLLASVGSLLTEDWCSLIFAVSLSGLLEAYTTQLDNAFVPLVFYSLLCL